jgi:hypothetical protein
MMKTGSTSQEEHAAPEPPLASISPAQAVMEAMNPSDEEAAKRAQHEQRSFWDLRSALTSSPVSRSTCWSTASRSRAGTSWSSTRSSACG